MISSDALEFEVDQAPAGPRKAWLEEVLRRAVEYVSITRDIENRATVLEAREFKNIDAYHIASAEAAHADCFCTCDDRLLRLARKQVDLQTRIVAPLEIMQELEQ